MWFPLSWTTGNPLAPAKRGSRVSGEGGGWAGGRAAAGIPAVQHPGKGRRWGVAGLCGDPPGKRPCRAPRPANELRDARRVGPGWAGLGIDRVRGTPGPQARLPGRSGIRSSLNSSPVGSPAPELAEE